MAFVPKTRREKLLYDSMRAATDWPRGSATPLNYSVYDGGRELESDMSRDEAVGFARGLEYVCMTYAGYMYNAVVRCGAFIVYPEDRYGEIVGMPEEDT